MPSNAIPATTAVHRLLYRALVEMRAQGQEHNNKVVFHLADLFHNVALDMEAASAGDQTYCDVLSTLTDRAREKGLDRWLAAALADVTDQYYQSHPVG